MFRYGPSLAAAAILAAVAAGADHELKYRLSLLPEEEELARGLAVKKAPKVKVPQVYDFEKRRPECKIDAVDRGDCAAGWALGAAQLVRARRCLGAGSGAGGGVSAGRLLSCCEACGAGCYGGSARATLLRAARGPGLPPEACHPYATLRLQPGLRHRAPPCPLVDRCTAQGNYTLTVIKEVYAVEDIQREIVARGPVLSRVALYSDLVGYRAGTVYSPGGGALLLGRDPVLVVGWGSRPSPYWLVRTTLGPPFGTLWLARGDAKIELERNAIAVTP